jgi:hypothetical protein
MTTVRMFAAALLLPALILVAVAAVIGSIVPTSPNLTTTAPAQPAKPAGQPRPRPGSPQRTLAHRCTSSAEVITLSGSRMRAPVICSA